MIERQHVLTAIVAVVALALALPDGGYSTGVFAGVTLLVWWTVVGLIAFDAGQRADVSTPALVAGAALAGLAILSALSIAWASDDGRALAEAVRAAGYAGLFALVLILSRAGDARGWLTGIAIAFATVAVLALLSRIQPSLPGGDEDIAQIIPGPLARLSYPIGYWNGLAACMAVALVLLTWLGAMARTPPARALGVGAIPLCGLTIYLTSSRGGVVAAVLGLAVLALLGRERVRILAALLIGAAATGVLVLLASRRDELVDGIGGEIAARQGDEMTALTLIVVVAAIAVSGALDGRLARLQVPRSAARASLAALGVVLVVGIAVADPAQRLDEFNDPPAEEVDTTDFVASHITSSTGSGRYQYWGTAVDAFEEQPLRGIGAGAYEAFWNEHGSLPRPVRDAHSLILEPAAELGILGLGLVLAFFGAAAVATSRWLRGSAAPEASAAAAVLVAGGFVAATDWTWEIPAVFAPVVIAAALLTGPATAEPGAGATRSSFGLGVATLVIGWLAICASAIVLLTELKLDDSQDAAREGDLPAAARDARDAITLQPWAAEPRLQLALVEERAGDLAAARERLDQAIERAPDDWRLWLVSARIETKAGEIQAAEKALERARELNPRAPILSLGPASAAGPAEAP